MNDQAKLKYIVEHLNEATFWTDGGGECTIEFYDGPADVDKIIATLEGEDEEEEEDNTCPMCHGTNIGQHGDPNTSPCTYCKNGEVEA